MRDVAIVLDGVLRKRDDTHAQDSSALLLYLALVEQFRVVILGTLDPFADEHFLTVNGFHRYVELIPEFPSDSPLPSVRKQIQIDRLRARGYHLEMVIVPDPGLVKHLYREGIPSLLYLHPEYSSKEFRPDYSGGVKPWAELQATVDYTRVTKAKEEKRKAEENDE